MKVVCSWCKKVMRETPDHSDLLSHGICEDCKAEVERRYEKKEAKK